MIAKGKETKDMKEECGVASRPEGSGSDKGICAQIVRKTSRPRRVPGESKSVARNFKAES